MNFSIIRKFFTKKYVVSELYINGKFYTHIKEGIMGSNITFIIPKGTYQMNQFYSVKNNRIVYGLIDDRNFLTYNKKYISMQKGGDLDTLSYIKFPYRFSQKKHKINIS